MPGFPELDGRIIVTHTSRHIFLGHYTVSHSPEPKEPPYNQQLEPDEFQIPI